MNRIVILQFNKGQDTLQLRERALPSQRLLCSVEIFWIWHNKLGNFVAVH